MFTDDFNIFPPFFYDLSIWSAVALSLLKPQNLVVGFIELHQAAVV